MLHKSHQMNVVNKIIGGNENEILERKTAAILRFKCIAN